MKNNRTKAAIFRVTEKEKEDILRKAGKVKKSQSDYLRKIVLEDNIAVVDSTKLLKQLNKISAELNKSGSNVNQVVKQVNIEAKRGELSDMTIEAFNEVVSEYLTTSNYLKDCYMKLLHKI
ncbi:MAG: hypothetical protein AAGA43_15660 [Bacteroidota bacterium]